MNLVLIGFMASGKTAVGRRLARRLGYGFLDTDQLIENEIGCTIAQFFEIKGEAAFRHLETKLADHLSSLRNYVVATGGGILTTPGNLERLQKAGMVIFLKADQEEIIQRLERDVNRPLVKKGNLRETVERLNAERLPEYSRSDLIIDTRNKGVNRVSGEIIRLIADHLTKQDNPPDANPPDEEPKATGAG